MHENIWNNNNYFYISSQSNKKHASPNIVRFSLFLFLKNINILSFVFWLKIKKRKTLEEKPDTEYAFFWTTTIFKYYLTIIKKKSIFIMFDSQFILCS